MTPRTIHRLNRLLGCIGNFLFCVVLGYGFARLLVAFIDCSIHSR